jgi:hypothetical protein
MSSVQRGSVGSGGSVQRLVGRALDVVRFWESNVLVGELVDLVASHVRVAQHGGSDDLDGVTGGGMTTGHLHVHLGDGAAEGHVSELFVHVDGIGTGQVTQNDAVVSDGAGLLLEDLRRRDDLTLDLADLVLSLHVVPELRPGEHGVALEHTHSVELGLRNVLRGQGSADDVELLDL